MSQIVRVSDVLIHHINSWNDGDLISITSGTGSGKSYFIKNLLYAHAKKENRKILYLVNRRRLYQQFKNEIEQDKKTDIIDLFLYQKLEAHSLYKDRKTLKNYKYVVCDEFHYFITDASFNHKTDLSLDIILGNSKDKVNIFMSATSGFMLDYLEKHKKMDVKKYDLESNYSHIEKLYFYKNNDTVKKFLFELKEHEKAIYFCHSAKMAYELSKEFENSMFICSEGNNQYSRHMDRQKVSQMLMNERFEEQILFATNALDNGVNIIDPDVKHVIIDIEDFDVLIQCLGRKRCINNERINVIIKCRNNQTFGGKISQLKRKIEMAEFLSENSLKDFIKKYPRQHYGNMIYDSPDPNNDHRSTKEVNDIMFHKVKYDIELLEELVKNDNGYIEHLLNILKTNTYELLEDHYDEMTVNDYLNSIVGKKMFMDEQKKFKEWLEKNLINAPKKRNGKIGLPTINQFLNENGYGYKIMSARETSGENRFKHYWVVGKIVY